MCLAMAALPFHAAAVEPATQRLEVFLADLKTLRADFAQTVFDENMGRLEDSSGTVSVQRPGNLRWDYTKPYHQLILATAGKVWIYDSELAQVTVKNLGDAVGNTPALLLTSERPLSDSFAVHELGARGGLAWVELVPKKTDSSFTAVRLGFASQDLSVMELVDQFGQTSQLRFFNLVRNEALPSGLFEFTPPPGVDIIADPETSSAQ